MGYVVVAAATSDVAVPRRGRSVSLSPSPCQVNPSVRFRELVLVALRIYLG